MMNKQNVDRIFSILQRENPNPTTELVYHSSFELLISVLLSAQATDISVNKATKTLYAVANTPEAILALGEETLKSHIKSIGLYQTKAKHIMATCHILLTEHQGVVPDSREALEKLPGVGRKTANVILNTAFQQPTIAVDTHIFRISNRLGIAKGKTPLAIEKQLEKIIPKPYLLNAHHWLILHGRYICTARKPKCAACLLYNDCTFTEKTA